MKTILAAPRFYTDSETAKLLKDYCDPISVNNVKSKKKKKKLKTWERNKHSWYAY